MYRGYIKVYESQTGELAIGPQIDIKEWIESMQNSFKGYLELSFEERELSLDEKKMIDGKLD